MKNDENDEKVDIVKMPEFGVLEQASEKIGKNNFEYFGDKFLVMDDFYSDLDKQQRFFMLGKLMNPNNVHYFYSEYDAMVKSFLGMFLNIQTQQKMMNEEELPTSLSMTEPETKPDIYF